MNDVDNVSDDDDDDDTADDDDNDDDNYHDDTEDDQETTFNVCIISMVILKRHRTSFSIFVDYR